MSPAGVLFVYQWLWVQLSVILWSSPFFCMWRWFSNWHFAPLVVCHYSSSWQIHLPVFVILWNSSQILGIYFCNCFQEVCNSCVIYFFLFPPTDTLWTSHMWTMTPSWYPHFWPCQIHKLREPGPYRGYVTPWPSSVRQEGMPGNRIVIFHIKSRVGDLSKRSLCWCIVTIKWGIINLYNPTDQLSPLRDWQRSLQELEQ